VIHRVGAEVAGKRVTCGSCKKEFLAPTPPAGGSPPPVHSADRPWSLHVDGHTQGPFALKTVIEQIQEKKIDGATLAWKDGMGDWKPLAEIPDFRDVLAVPGGAAAVGRGGSGVHKAHGIGHLAASHPIGLGHRAAEDEEGEHRRPRFDRDRKNREIIIGAWIAGVLVIITMFVLFAVLNQPTPEAPKPAPPPEPRASVPEPEPAPVTPTVSKKAAPKAKAGMPAEKRLASVVSDLEKRFPAIIAAHKKGDAKPIGTFIRYLRMHAESLGECQWGGHQAAMTTFLEHLSQAASGIESELKQKPWVGGGLGEGVDEKHRVEALRLNETEWLDNWVKILRADIQKLRDGGLQF
jgi:hypothetical protein